VKTEWDDGAQVTWCRDALADKPIEILDSTANRDASAQTEVTGHALVAEPEVEPEPSQADGQDNPVRTDARRRWE
jgi:hypothetical protein